jgi:hypothetical protein
MTLFDIEKSAKDTLHICNVKTITFSGIHMLGILLMLASILQMLLLSTGKLMDFLLSPSDMIW